MAIIYTNEDLLDQGYLSGAKLDFQEEEKENSIELEMGLNDYNKLSVGCYVYDEDNPQFGGIIKSIRIRTEDKNLVFGGLTFAGILSTKIIEPPENAAYRIISGTIKQKVDSILDITGLSTIFYTDAAITNTSAWQIDRYTDVLSAFRKLALQNGRCLLVSFDKLHEGQKLKISFLPPKTIVAGEAYDSDLFNFLIEKDLMPVNHLICLGRGELTDRQVYHIYRIDDNFYYKDTNTSNVYDIENNQIVPGFLENWSYVNEVASVYDYSSVESYDELKKEGLKHFQELLDNGTKLEITPPEEEILKIGDTIAGLEQRSGLYVEKSIKKIIYKSNENASPTITYETTNTKGL